ncbi:MAG: hypothetical protein K940chlam3_00838 [Chlamydiae bacterium]|nr:hypothetical protein [Chlamydiota bacterium]
MEVNFPPIASSARTIFPEGEKEDRFDQIAQQILKNPMSVLVPTLPIFYETLIEDDKHDDRIKESCRHLEIAVQNVPFFQNLAEVPTNFLNQYRTEDRHHEVKQIGKAYLSQDENLLDHIFLAVKKRLSEKDRKTIWSQIMDWFIDELEEARGSHCLDHDDIENPMSHYFVVSFLRLHRMMTSSILKPLIDLAFMNYHRAPKRVKSLILMNINRFLEIAVDKTEGGKQIHKHRKVVAQYLYEIIDIYLLESNNLLYFRECLTLLISKVHGEDVEREVLKEKYLEAFWRIIDDFEKSEKLRGALLQGMRRVDDIVHSGE